MDSRNDEPGANTPGLSNVREGESTRQSLPQPVAGSGLVHVSAVSDPFLAELKERFKADKRHAIELALKTWPDKSASAIADQLGCSHTWVNRTKSEVETTFNLPERVTGKDGKSPGRRPAA